MHPAERLMMQLWNAYLPCVRLTMIGHKMIYRAVVSLLWLIFLVNSSLVKSNYPQMVYGFFILWNLFLCDTILLYRIPNLFINEKIFETLKSNLKILHFVST